MEARLLVTAANGVDAHVGSDHDHIADYRPALTAMGLDGWLHSIVADEVSPVMRGHFNAYPSRQSGRANGGAPRWWQGVESTDWLFGQIRGILDEGGIIQANHPAGDSGMFSLADYSPAAGVVADPNRWSNDFDAMELINSNEWESYFPFYVDLVSRGKRVTPVGVSDSHSARGGNPGLNLTFLYTGGTAAEFSPEVLEAAMAARATVASHGPYIDARIGGAWAPGTEVGPATLDVTVYAPSWIPVETVHLWENDVEVATEGCTGAAPTPCTARFALNPASDAAYVVTADSTTPMTEWFAGHTAFAATSAILVDRTGDGWTAPKPALLFE
jgi:hypothetical protein